MLAIGSFKYNQMYQKMTRATVMTLRTADSCVKQKMVQHGLNQENIS
ncbi:hypothetical protein QE382_000049 [Sphingobacterium zeae]|uniref:Uncharacterized protein n=1 Tax=Sphingobacterium zeae TaxID=1776859 RepID=A0ABU0TZD3_9SPHI|nr:hypothetical protein [Sphingobacterium zeae]